MITSFYQTVKIQKSPKYLCNKLKVKYTFKFSPINYTQRDTLTFFWNISFFGLII